MKIVLRVNESETVNIQKKRIAYTKEIVDSGNDNRRNISVLTDYGYWFHLSLLVSDMQNAFTYLTYDDKPYVLTPDWVKITDKAGNLLKIIKGID